LQNLVVCPALTKRGKSTGKFGVIAGGRRLRALRALAADGTIGKDEEILCRIVTRDRATIASVAENSGREPMSNADTIVSFAAMVRNGKSVEDLAVAFGVSAVTVQRRLRLANVSPKLFDLFREGGIDLEQLMGLAFTEDHARQEAIWDAAPGWQCTGPHLRRMALGQAVNAATDKLARYVGLDAYIEAGGQVLRDLFSDDDQGYCADPQLLASLAGDKIAAERDQLLAGGVAWVDIVDDYDHRARQNYVPAPTSQREPTKAEKGALKEAQRKLAAAAKAMAEFEDANSEVSEDDVDQAAYDSLEEAVNTAEAEIEELQGNLRVVAEDVQALCGVVLAVESNGQLRAYRNLVRKEDAKKATNAANRSTSTTAEGGQGRAGAEGSDGADASEAASGLSDALTRRLSAQKTVALQVEVARHPHVALAVLAESLMSDLCIGPHSHGVSNITARSRKSDLTLADASIESSKAWGELGVLIASVEAQLPEDDDNGLLPWLLAQPLDTLVHLLALCTALTVSAGGLRRESADPIIQAVDLDMTKYWTASGEAYFKSVSKALIAQAIAEVDPETAKTVDKLKKGEAVAVAEAKMKDTGWLPSPLRRD